MRHQDENNPYTRIDALEAELRRQRALVDQERKRADALEQSAHTAWAVAMRGPSPRKLAE